MWYAERLHLHILIFKYEARVSDLMGLNTPALVISRLLTVEPIANIFLIGLQHLISHVLGALRTKQFQRLITTHCPSGQDEVGQAHGMI